MQKLPRQEQKGGEEQGHLVVLGAEDAEQLSQCRKEILCSELMQLKMQIQTDPKSSQMHVRLAKAKGS